MFFFLLCVATCQAEIKFKPRLVARSVVELCYSLCRYQQDFPSFEFVEEKLVQFLFVYGNKAQALEPQSTRRKKKNVMTIE